MTLVQATSNLTSISYSIYTSQKKNIFYQLSWENRSFTFVYTTSLLEEQIIPYISLWSSTF